MCEEASGGTELTPPFSINLTMDTIIACNDFPVNERVSIPLIPQKLLLRERLFTKPWYRLTDFIVNHFCCGASTFAEEWEFDVMTKRTVVSMLDDDIEFTDLTDYFNNAKMVEVGDEQEALRIEIMTDRVINLKEQPPLMPVCPGEEHDDGFNTHVNSAADAMCRVSVRQGLKWRRRKKRVVAFCVVALVNKVRCKYFHMEDNNANRRLVGSYLLKLMREHNFRTSDIHLHVKYAVDIYFETCVSGLKPVAHTRA